MEDATKSGIDLKLRLCNAFIGWLCRCSIQIMHGNLTLGISLKILTDKLNRQWVFLQRFYSVYLPFAVTSPYFLSYFIFSV